MSRGPKVPTIYRQLQERERLRKELENLREQRRKERAKLKKIGRLVEKKQENGLADLPAEVAVAIEAQPPVEQAEEKHAAVADADQDDLVKRLSAIRDRLLWLQAVYSTTLSPDIAIEADSFRALFSNLGEQLKAKNQDAYDSLVSGHEALLLSEPSPVKGTIPIEVQRRVELIWELRAKPRPRLEPRPVAHVPDGLGQFL